MKKPLISIIVPVYNTEKYLNKCLDSLINQTYKNIEIICINNGSTDNSHSILNQYQELDSRVNVVNTINEGVSIARNVALDIAKGEYIMFVDSDDWINLNTCEIAINTVNEQHADVVMWSYIREFSQKSSPKSIFESDKVFDEQECKKLHRRFIGLIDDELARIENADALCPVWGKLYKSSLIQKNNIRFTDIRLIGTYEDGLFNLNIFKYVKKAIFINQYNYHYRKDNVSSITTKYKTNFLKNWTNLYTIMKEYILENQLENIYIEALNNRISVNVLGLGLNVLNAEVSSYKKIKLIDEVINSKQYKNAVKNLKINYMPIHWKLFYLCAKCRFSVGVYILLLCIKYFINK